MSDKRPRGRPPHDDILTPAEWRIANAVRHGFSNRKIAERSRISVDGVKFHISNILGKLQLEDRRQLRLWQGEPKGASMQNQPEATTIATIGQLSRSVRDIAQSEQWYRDIIGLPHLYTYGNLAFFNCDGTRLMLSAEGKFTPELSIIYFKVPDINAAYKKLTEHGVTFTNAPHMIHRHEDGTEEWMAFFNDLEDRPLALMCQRKLDKNL